MILSDDEIIFINANGNTDDTDRADFHGYGSSAQSALYVMIFPLSDENLRKFSPAFLFS